VTVGLRCIRGGFCGVYADWKIDYSPTHHPDHGLGLPDDGPDRLRLVEGPVPEHREEHVGSSSREAEEGLSVVFALGGRTTA
jgi:hypothetical protein